MTRVLKPIIIDAPQRSEAWYASRLGNVTGSKGELAIRSVESIDLKNVAIRQLMNIRAVTAQIKQTDIYQNFLKKNGLELYQLADLEIPDNDKRIAYRKSRVAERLTGIDSNADMYVSKEMVWGQTNERLAIARYQMVTGNKVDEAFFMLHPELRCGASPDGHVTDVVTGELGVLEVKCLKSTNHLYKIAKLQEVPQEHEVQIQMEMWLSNVDFCDFVGYDSRVPGKLDIFIKRVKRDDWFIDNVLEPEIRLFLSEVDRDERFFRKLAREGFKFNLDEFRGLEVVS